MLPRMQPPSASPGMVPAADPGRGERLANLATFLVVGLCSWLYLWTALPPPHGAFGHLPGGYYELQTAGFNAGHLNVALEPHPALLRLPDPYDPVANGPFRAHDMSLWHGKYYMYFGVTPVLVLFWPVWILTGYYPSQPFAVALFLTLGLAVAAALLTGLRRRYWAGCPAWVLPVAATCLGLANPGVMLTQGVRFYEVPIACAYGLHMLTLAVLARAVCDRRGSVWWLALGSLLFGLTLGARPNYLPGGVLLALAGGWILRRERKEPDWRWITRTPAILGAAFAPAAAIGAGLLLYNYLRFGSPTEFGMKYQLAGSDQRDLVSFSTRFLWQNFRIYLWGYGTWSPYFPYFIPNANGVAGLARYVPWAWLAFLALFARPPAARMFAVLLAAAAAGNLALLSFFAGVNDRYAVDVVAPWLLGGGVGALVWGQAWGRAGTWLRRGCFRMAVLGAAVYSIGIGQAMFFRRVPAEGAALEFARFMNQPVAWLQRLRQEPLGGLRLEIELPAGREGVIEPLFQTGFGGDNRDWLQIEYLAGNRVRLGFLHAGLGLLEAQDMAVPADRRLTVEVACGSLTPPLGHPVYSGLSLPEAVMLRRDLLVRVNGREVLRALLDCYESNPGDLRIGSLSSQSGSISTGFTGRILRSERLPFAAQGGRVPELTERAPIEFSVIFPAGKGGSAEPLLVTGEGNRSDLLYCVYEGRNRVRFALDHYGNGGPTTELIEFDPLRPHRMLVWFGSLQPPGGPPAPGSAAPTLDRRLVVIFDGKVVLNNEQIFYPASPESAFFGFNAYGSDVVSQRFSGRISDLRPVALSQLPELSMEGGRGAVEMTLMLPSHVLGVSDPLVVTGVTGAGNMIYVRYLDDRRVSFGFDHWGVRGLTGPAVEIDYSQPHRLEITMGSLYGPDAPTELRTLVRVRLDGKVVLEGNSPCHPSEPGQIRLLANLIGGSTCGPVFNGRAIAVERLPVPRP
jgi:hypothetical protein